jgi:hypothetical protein
VTRRGEGEAGRGDGREGRGRGRDGIRRGNKRERSGCGTGETATRTAQEGGAREPSLPLPRIRLGEYPGTPRECHQRCVSRPVLALSSSPQKQASKTTHVRPRPRPRPRSGSSRSREVGVVLPSLRLRGVRGARGGLEFAVALPFGAGAGCASRGAADGFRGCGKFGPVRIGQVKR